MVGGLRPEGAASAWLSRSTGEAIKPPFYFLVGTMNQNLISANGHQAVACMSGGRTEERLHPSSGEVRCVVQIPRRLVAAQVYPEGPGGLVPIPAVLILGRGLGVVDRLDREPKRLHLFQEHLEACRHAGLRYVLALDDGLVALDPTDPIVALYRQQLLQGVRRAVGLERPHLHLAEPLSAELGLAAQRLLCYQRVWSGAPGVDLVVHQVQELQYVHVTDGDPAIERLAGAPVIQRHLAAAAHADVGETVAANPLDGLIYVADLGAREDGRGDVDRLAAVLPEALARSPPEVGLEDLAYVHPARHAERTQDNVHRRPVLHERHVLFWHDLGDDPLVAVPTRELVALRDLALGGHEDTHHLVDAGLELVAFVPAEALDVYDDAALAVRYLQRRVLHLARLLAEDRAQQLLLRRRLALALGGNLADEHVARSDLRPYPDDPVGVEVHEDVVRGVGDVAGYLLGPELRIPCLDLVLLDVYGGEGVILDDPLGDDDRVLEVVALPRHESHEQVLPQSQLALVGRGAVGQHCAGFDLLALGHERPLVDAGALVGAGELAQRVLVHLATLAPDRDPVRHHPLDGAGVAREEHVAGIRGRPKLHPCADVRGLAPQERHSLPLHVRAHERPVGVVVLEERYERRRHRDGLQRRHVHVVDLVRSDGRDIAASPAGEDLVGVPDDLTRLQVYRRVGLGDRVLLLLVGGEVLDLISDRAVNDLPVRRLHEAVLIYGRKRRELSYEPDVRTLWRLYGAHPPVVGRVHVAHLYGRPLPAQTARAHGAQAPPVRQPAQRVRLVHELRELRGAEELLYGAGDRLGVDDGLRRYGLLVLGGHPLAHHPLHAVHPDPERLLHQLPDGPQTPVAEVLVLVELVPDALVVYAPELLVLGDLLRDLDEAPQQGLDVLDGEGVVLQRHVELELLVDLVAPHLREVVALGIEEEPVHEVLRVLQVDRLAVALTPEYLQQGLLPRRGVVPLQGIAYEPGAAEAFEDLFRPAHPEGLEQHRDRQLALPVDAHGDVTLGLDLELEPRAAAGHEARRQDLLGGVLRLHDVGAGRTHELRDHDPLGPVDDEGARLRHEWEVAHEDVLLPDLARLLD